ncbi:MAG TPA: Maf family nucleotide pyrophosphatase [Rhodanobacteraceae bacterium]|nr:Maf family nucleotide pyrophosphatase [Rhodanobacteraceae bacterium]
MLPDELDLVLASSSPYRRELLTRLTPRFRIFSPGIDETPHSDETAAELAVRLAAAKTTAIVSYCPGAMVIGCDQTAECEGRLLGKSGARDAAQAQLADCSGRMVTFYTALCLADARSTPQMQSEMDVTRVVFRTLQADEIGRYVERERPFDCTGSFRVEGLGIALFERIESNDPTALIGLPLIALCRLLRSAGCAMP